LIYLVSCAIRVEQEEEEEVPSAVDPAIVSAELARQVTENPIFREAVGEMRMFFVNAIVASTPDATNVREEAYKQIKFLDVFVNTLTGYIVRVAARQEEMGLP
jgi:hypothetical protein